jgi:hypothetical protein
MSFGGGGGGGGAIGSATDVLLNNPITNNVLGYNAGSSKWVNDSLTGLAALAVGGGAETLSALGNKVATTNIDLTTGNVFTITLGASITLTFSGATVGRACSVSLYIKQDATGSRLITWPASVKWAGGTKPTLSTAANALDIVVVESLDGGTTWYGSLVGTSFS